MDDKIVLHSDLNHFYAAVECLVNPKIRKMPVAVCGDPEARHGIVLTKNPIAKKFGVTTGQAIWQAKQLCPALVVVKPNYDLYLEFSKRVREIYYDYTDIIESFGIDECWLDCSGSTLLHGNGEEIAHKIRRQIYKELGITVSIGVSFNKIFSKLASDYKKPDAVTVFNRGNYRERVWPMPVSELLYVGRATNAKFKKWGIKTIGDLAAYDTKLLYNNIGVIGIMLQRFANGADHSPVTHNSVESVIKSIGNSSTMPRDLISDEDVWAAFTMLSESVASRLRDHGFRCRTVQISIRDKDLISCERQGKLPVPSCLSTEITAQAMRIFKEKYVMSRPLRSIGVRACDLVTMDTATQLSLLWDHRKQEKLEIFERTVDEIRKRFGHYSIQKASLMLDPDLTGHNPKENVIHPYALFTDKLPI